MLSVPIFWFFLRGWATGSRRWFILSGIWMGLAGYTYSAARLLPIILVASLLPEFFLESRANSTTQRSLRTNQNRQTTSLRSRVWPYSKLKSRLINLSAFSLAALVIYLPLGLYLLTHPGQFTARAYSVMVWNYLDTQAEIVAEIGRNLIRVGGFFCCDGSPNPLFGWPNYPGSHLLLLPFLVIGLIGSLRYGRYFFPRLVALWWLIGLIPTVIAIEAPHPLRMIVAVVPTAILIALGPVYLAQWLEIRTLRSVSGRLFVFAGLIILIPAVGSFSAYFNRWTGLQSTRGAYDYAAVAIHEAILDQTDAANPIYLPLASVNAPSLLYYLSDPFPRQASLAAAPAAGALVISPDQHVGDPTWVRFHHDQTIVLPPLSSEGQQLIREALTGSGTEPIRTADGEIIARLARLATDPVRFVEEVGQPLEFSFGPLSLTGATYPPVIDRLADIPITLLWTANRAMADDYEILVRLVDDNRRAWANGDARPTGWVYPTSFWRPGIDEIAARHDLVMGPDPPPPGRYWLAVSIFDPGRGRRLPLANPDGDSPDTVFLGPLKVPLAEVTSPDATQNIAPVTFGDTVQLTGFSVDQSKIKPGQSIQLNLFWHALARPEVDYTIFVHLLDSDDNLVAGRDAQPLAGQYPTTIWAPGEEIMDQHTLPVPVDLPQGQYRLAVGLYYLATGERLPLRFENGATGRDGRLTLDLALTVTD
jgi:hypothetical protein